jgi:pyruvate dehydrogenase E2 component (dihydrolipoamide acetyltransferase)
MRHPVIVPSLGLVESVTLLEWLPRSGDTVTKGQILATIETEKAQVEIESPADGKLEIVIEAGPELVSVEAVLGYVDDQNDG